jgi:hypothetical protein
VLFPQSPEQQGVANRVCELNAGIFLKDTSPETIRNSEGMTFICTNGWQKPRGLSKG